MVTICLLLGCVALGLMALGAYLLIHGGHVPEAPPVAAQPPVVAPPAPAPPVVRRETVTIRWVTPEGRVIGETAIDRRARRAQMTRTHRGKTAMFAASHRDGDVWVYRYLHGV